MFSASKTAAPVSGSFQVSNSLRFRQSASAYLNRTPASVGNRRTFTWSGWVKRGALGVTNYLFCARTSLGGSAGVIFTGLNFTSSDTLNFRNYIYGTGEDVAVTTSQVFRDPSAWYHIALAVDTTQSTSSNRVKMYVNGVQVTAFSSSTYPSQNEQFAINYNFDHQQARETDSAGAGVDYYDGYWSEVNFIDGQALTPSSFGSINATTGVWQPARYTGSYGTNGFYLKFNNGTSTTTLGNDSSGNNNNWTTNNISLTAGSTYDWMIDSPTSYAGSSYGVGNYAVLNPVDTYSTSPTFSNANLTISTPTFGYGAARSTISVSSGQWYWEVTVTSNSNGGPMIGIYGTTATLTGIYTTASGYAYEADTGQKWNNGSGASYGSSYTVNDVIGVALNLNSGTLTFYKNGVSQGTAFTGLAGSFCAAASDSSGSGSSVIAANFGQRPFSYTPPTGFKSLCTQNLPAPAIYNGANHMAATTYTGTGSSLSISNSVNSASFQPDLVWIKSRSAATNNKLTDSVRGVTKGLISNTDGAETTDSQGVTAFGSSGFTVGTDTTYNNLSATYVGWQWKAGGTAVSNTSGTITSSVSANTTAGFSVVTYTGTGANATVGHGLGVAPSMVIIKNKTDTAGRDWQVYHISLASAANSIQLNTTSAQGSNTTQFNSTAPTSSVFSIGTAIATNGSTNTFVAYCFAAIAGYSAFGSYTGNGSADGPFVYCGFRPRYVLIKRTDSAVDWQVYDTGRSTYNVDSITLAPNLSSAESYFASAYDIDIISNGFKARSGPSVAINASGGTYIYAAFAENPFQNSLAR